ncbi:cuticle protein 21-like [Bacillus rossius redtenbacheri]|uniref:cuticle protein 21-like n=1 Tax=Bacillus rossius redtenbacheri TaxID=93214 RepID=UPI002FDD4AE8
MYKLVIFAVLVAAAAAAPAPAPGYLGSPLVAAPGYLGAPLVAAPGIATYTAAYSAPVAIPAPAVYAAPARVAYSVEPVEQHGYKIVY